MHFGCFSCCWFREEPALDHHLRSFVFMHNWVRWAIICGALLLCATACIGPPFGRGFFNFKFSSVLPCTAASIAFPLLLAVSLDTQLPASFHLSCLAFAWAHRCLHHLSLALGFFCPDCTGACIVALNWQSMDQAMYTNKAMVRGACTSTRPW